MEADRHRSATALAAAAIVAVALGAPSARADNGAGSDPKGDSAPNAGGPGPAFTDIRKVKHGHTKSGRLRHVVFVRDAGSATKALTQLEVKAGGKLYLIDSGGVDRLRAGSAAAAKGKVKVRRRGDKIVFKFGPRVIGDPRRYRWAATIGSNDTSPLDFDRAPDGSGMLEHRLRGNRSPAERPRFRGYRAGADGKPSRVAGQGELHEFVFIDRERERTRYRLVLEGPGDTRTSKRARTGRRGRDAIDLSLFVNDEGGPGKWKAKWRVGGEKVARYRFKLKPEFEG